MLAAPLPGDEQARMLDLALAVVSLVDSDRLWFKSPTGIESDGTSRALSLSAHAILLQEPLVVPDLPNDPRFCDRPTVRASPGRRFYAGAPLRLRPGSAWVTLSILDRWPRNLASVDVTMWRDLASLVIRELQLMEQASADGLVDVLARTGSDAFVVLATHTQPSELLAALNRLGSAAAHRAADHRDGS